MKPCPLSNALIELLPGAIITRRREQDWRSATFSGVQLELVLRVDASDAAPAKAFTQMIGDHEFALPDLLVADILVTERQETENSIALTVEALLLNDDA
jgi:hypothetical protein